LQHKTLAGSTDVLLMVVVHVKLYRKHKLLTYR